MARSIIPSQQKLAEKLTLINDRGIGMLTRIYNIKKVSYFSFNCNFNITKSSLSKLAIIECTCN